jgi:hypothetical protein
VKEEGCHATYLSRIVHEAAVLHMADCTHCFPSQEESSSPILYTKIPMFVTFSNSPTEAKDFSLLFKKSPQKLPTTSLGSYIGLVAANNFSSSSSLQVGWANVKEL